jgi:uncharacterized protein (DUF362 family)
MQDIIAVYLQRQKQYDSDLLTEFFQECFSQEKLQSLRGAKVLIKPNLISSRGPELACTHPAFLLALADWLALSGATVVVGDSPAFGRASSVLRMLDLDKDLAKRGIKITEFEATVYRRLRCGITVGVAAESLECDLFVNAPKLKAHDQMYMTIAVKNIFGIIKGLRKSMLHMQYGGSSALFSQIILDLIELLPTHVSAVDGIDVMHRQGPLHGSCLQLGCVALSRDPVALDTSLLHALELNPALSPLWLEARKRSCPGTDMTKVRFPLDTPQQFRGAGFEVPLQLAPIRFNPLRFLYGNAKRFALRVSGK